MISAKALTKNVVIRLKSDQTGFVACLVLLLFMILFGIVVGTILVCDSINEEAVENSIWDNSIPQVKAWFEANADNPDSIRYVKWYPVRKLDDGRFRARVRYSRVHDPDSSIHEKVFVFDSTGMIIGVNARVE